MDPLAFLGAAGDVVQFVRFASSVVSSAAAIARSEHGASQNTLDLENIYENLQNYSRRLSGTARSRSSTESSGLRSILLRYANTSQQLDAELYIRPLEELAGKCNVLCGQLLEALQKRRVQRKANRFQSFIVALKSVCESKRIEELEHTLDQYQQIIALNFFPLISHQQSYLLFALSALRDESIKLQFDQSSKLDDLAACLMDIKHRLPSGPSEVEIETNDNGLHVAPNNAEGLLIGNQGANGNVTKMDLDEIDALVDGVSSMSLAESDLALIAKQQAFLRSLDYASRPLRHEDIPIAHKQTFQWILESDDKQEQASNKETSGLFSWLQNGDGIFWVSGKAGSGKSTLMKFIADHPKTRSLLEEWAEPQKLAIASHYFWTGGTAMQKTEKGLLQSLLYDIFRLYPEEIARICPQRWSKITLGNSATVSKEWLVRELLRALRMLVESPCSHTKYCIFIDGIDEFDGDHHKISQLLRELSTSPNFKFCLSSRPWNVFEDAFGMESSQMICVHDLTRRDILAYSQSKLSENWRWSQFSKEQVDSLLKHITERAQGVFLWVFLVTRSLRDGIINGDTMKQLEQRLQNLPTDLEPFFKHMLNQVDSIYHQRMARILQIAINAKQSLDLKFFQVLEFEEDDENYAINKSIHVFSPENIEKELDQCRRRINAQCGGLLEIKKNRVVFLHRTVRDFLLTRELGAYLANLGGEDFMTNLSTLKGFVFLFKCWIQSASWLSLADDEPFWREGLEYANEAIDESPESALMHLDAVEDLYQNVKDHSDSIYLDVTADFGFRSEIIRAGVSKHIALKLEECPEFFNSVFEPPLVTVLNQVQWTENHMHIMAKFLESGQDPNDVTGNSPWHEFVQRTCINHDEHDFRLAIQNDIFSVFLKHGAKREVVVRPKMLAATGIDTSEHGARFNRGQAFASAHFIDALLSYECSHRLSHECLKALDDFLDTSSPVLGQQLEEITSVLTDHLDQCKEGLAIEPQRLRFFARIIQKVIKAGINIQSNMENLIPGLRQVFPGGGGTALIKMIQNKDPSQNYYSELSPHKRRRRGDASSSCDKRRRS